MAGKVQVVMVGLAGTQRQKMKSLETVPEHGQLERRELEKERLERGRAERNQRV